MHDTVQCIRTLCILYIMFTVKEIFQIVLLYMLYRSYLHHKRGGQMQICGFFPGLKRCELYVSVLHRSLLNQYPLDRPIGGIAGTIGKPNCRPRGVPTLASPTVTLSAEEQSCIFVFCWRIQSYHIH
jgi:hypothetical protein